MVKHLVLDYLFEFFQFFAHWECCVECEMNLEEEMVESAQCDIYGCHVNFVWEKRDELDNRGDSTITDFYTCPNDDDDDIFTKTILKM